MPAQMDVALGALEPHFRNRALALLGAKHRQDQLASAFVTRTTADWEGPGIRRGRPLDRHLHASKESPHEHREAVIVDAVRTPVGKRGGALSRWHPVDLLGHTLRNLMDRNDIDPMLLDDVIAGCVLQHDQQSSNIGRHAVLSAGLPSRFQPLRSTGWSRIRPTSRYLRGARRLGGRLPTGDRVRRRVDVAGVDAFRVPARCTPGPAVWPLRGAGPPT